MAEEEVYSPENSSHWHFKPVPDRADVCESLTSALNAYADLYGGKTYVKLPAIWRGYVYHYNNKVFKRKAVPSREILERIWTIGDQLYARPDVMGLNKSKASDALCEFVFELQRTTHLFPSESVFSCLDSAKLKQLEKQIGRLKKPPLGIKETLEELQSLRKQLVYF